MGYNFQDQPGESQSEWLGHENELEESNTEGDWKCLDARFVLISFYNRCTQQKPCWEVYGHINLGHNEKIASYKTEEEAIKMAMKYSWIGVPVIAGSRGNWEPVLRKILNKTSRLKINKLKTGVKELERGTSMIHFGDVLKLIDEVFYGEQSN